MLVTDSTHAMARRHRASPQPAYERFAVYFAPEPETPLAEFARNWFGDDAESGSAAPRRWDYGLGPETVAAITKTPGRYGLHATLKPPFRLKSDVSADALAESVERFARARAAVSLGPLQLATLGRFLALTPRQPVPEIAHLHAQCLFAFERFRAPLSKIERARRLAPDLSPHQRVMLAQWGYPYVLTEFRFHVTLTGELAAKERERILPALAPALKDVLAAPVTFDSLCLFGDPGHGAPFRLIGRFPLQG